MPKERERISKRLQQQLVCVWWTDANWIAQWRNGSGQFFLKICTKGNRYLFTHFKPQHTQRSNLLNNRVYNRSVRVIVYWCIDANSVKYSKKR